MIAAKSLAGSLLTLVLAACAPQPLVVEQPDFIPDNMIPPLVLPADASSGGGGGGGGGGPGRQRGQGAQFEFHSELTLEGMHAHFYDQLYDAAWEPRAKEADEASRSTFWEVTDERGRTWAAKLVVEQLGTESSFRYRISVDLIVP